MWKPPFDLKSNPSVIGRIVTATITLVTVLIVYDGWATLKFFDVFLLVLAPIVAIFTSHVFSSSLVEQVELGRRPTMHEWLELVRFEDRASAAGVPATGPGSQRRHGSCSATSVDVASAPERRLRILIHFGGGAV